MTEPAENVVWHAERIAAAEQDRMISSVSETLQTARNALADMVGKITELRPAFEQFRQAIDEGERLQDEQLAALEDDFWSGLEPK